MHDDRDSEVSSDLSPIDHSLSSTSGRVEVVTFNLASLSLSLITGFTNEEESISPPHERLRIDILIVLGEIEATA